MHPFVWIYTKGKLGEFWTETHPPSKFGWNLFNSFCVILLTNQGTGKTNTSENTTYLVKVIERTKKLKADNQIKNMRHNKKKKKKNKLIKSKSEQMRL